MLKKILGGREVTGTTRTGKKGNYARGKKENRSIGVLNSDRAIKIRGVHH